MKIRFDDVADVLPIIWKNYTTKEIATYFDVCENTVWRWISALQLPEKKVGRRPIKVTFKEDNYGLKLGDAIICLWYDNDVIIGNITEFLEDKAVIQTKEGKKKVHIKKCRKLVK